MNIKDSRGNDALDDARRENRTAVVDYLINEALVRNSCHSFEGGIFLNGLRQVISVLHKKFSDLQILVSELIGRS